ncbi:MAG: hypothetical protein ABW277_22555 [Longimicrobiaceae bacterium]
MEDPAAEPDEGRRHAAFRQAVLYLSLRIDLLLALPFGTLERRAVESACRRSAALPKPAPSPSP